MNTFFAVWLFFFSASTLWAQNFNQVPEGAMLGSEITWANLGGAVKMGVSIAAGKKRVAMIGVREDKSLWYRTSGNYAAPFSFTPGCSGNDCWNNYAPYMKEFTEWSDWKQLPWGKFSPFVTPKTAVDSEGNIFVVAAAINTANNEEYVVLQGLPHRFRPVGGGAENTNQDTLIDVNTSGTLAQVGSKKIVDIDFAILSNQDGFNQNQLVISVYRQDQSFELFERYFNYRDSRYGWRKVQMPDEVRTYSSERPRFRPFGKGHRYLAVIIKQTEGLKVITLKKALDGALPLAFNTIQTVPNTENHHSLDLQVLPDGLVILAYQQASGQLAMSSGLWANERFGFVFARNPGPTQYRYGEFQILKHFNEYFIVAKQMLGAVDLIRWDTFSGVVKWTTVGSIPLTDTSAAPAGFSLTQVDKEIYLADSKRDGSTVWINLLRASIIQFAENKRVFLHTNPAHRGPVHANGAFSDMALAFFAVPSEYLELFALQPSDRCHPGGWPTPLVCGKVFVDFDDYWGVPIIPAPSVPRYSELRDALNVLNDSDENTIWPLSWLKAFTGAVILKSSFKSPASIFHEWMHEVDFDLINGNLIPTVRDRFQSRFATLFNNRRNAFPSDGQRSIGFVSDYAENNFREDWADSAMNYRFFGDTFRHLMDVDKRLGSTLIQDKYNLLKDFFKGKEFSNEGTLNFGDNLRPLIAYWNNRRADVHTFSSADSEAFNIRNGYLDWRSAGHIYQAARPLTLELELWWSETRKDFFTTASAQGKADARAAGYRKVRTEGFIFTGPGTGRKALKLYWNSERQDNATLIEHTETENILTASGYVFVRVEGYVRLEAHDALTLPLSALCNNWPDTDIATTASDEQKATMSKYTTWRRQGYIWALKKEGMVELELYQHPVNKDNTLVTKGSAHETRITSEGYSRLRTEGYVYTAANSDANLSLKIYKNTTSGDYAAVAEQDSINWATGQSYIYVANIGYISSTPF